MYRKQDEDIDVLKELKNHISSEEAGISRKMKVTLKLPEKINRYQQSHVGWALKEECSKQKVHSEQSSEI